MDSAVFKAITGGDRITAEQKYRDSFEFTPFVRLLFSANQLPANRYSSRAYYERWLIIPFERSFRHTRQEIPRQVLDHDLARPDELSGALNLGLPAIRRLRAAGRFSAGRGVIGTSIFAHFVTIRAWPGWMGRFSGTRSGTRWPSYLRTNCTLRIREPACYRIVRF